MLLPNELLLDVLSFADFGTLVSAKFVGARFLDAVAKFAAKLASRRSFQVLFFTSYITYVDVTVGARRKSIRYTPSNQSSIAAACRDVAEVIGPHAVAKLMFLENTWNMPGIGVIFEGSPALKYAEDVGLYSEPDATIANSCEAFMLNFAGTKSLRLSLNYDNFSWTFLGRESARDLRRIKVSGMRDALNEDVERFVEELVCYCATLPHLLAGEALEIEFPGIFFYGGFALRVMELLKDSGRELTLRMNTRNDCELMVDNTVDVEGSTTRYASDKSTIFVEVKGRLITIKSTAKVRRTKPGTSEE